MILLYHKVAPTAPTEWWVTADTFDRQLAALAAFDVVYLADYDPSNPRHVVITFDGVYENVYSFALPLLRKWGYPFELFVTGDYIGQNNAFDSCEPLTTFCTIEQLHEMTLHGGRIQWHTASHRRLDTLSEADMVREIAVPEHLKSRFPSPHIDWFAYPHGDHSDTVLDAVRARFSGALSCVAGNDTDRFQLNRLIVSEETKLDKSRVSIIVANYNYGVFLPEAMESVIKQTVPADEIILIDDCSTDGSQQIALRYKDVAQVVLNEHNLGIVDNFNKAVSLASGDYIAFLGADNRMRSDYIEKCKTALDKHPDAAVAYTDMIIFGARSSHLAESVGALPFGESAAERWPVYLWRFPEPTDAVVNAIHEKNFIHGSSMYRRDVFEQVGGYRKSEGPEDHGLFTRMLRAGWKPVRVSSPLIEYRQHSTNQANTVLSLQLEIAALRQQISRVAFERDQANTALAKAQAERDTTTAASASLTTSLVEERDAILARHHAILHSHSWRITKPLRLTLRIARYGLVDSDRRRLIQELKAVYHRMPLPDFAKTAMRWTYHRIIKQSVLRGRAASKQNLPFEPPSAQAAVQQQGVRDYFIWGVIDWHFRFQRPQQLAQVLANSGRRVFYVSSNLVDDARPGFEVEALDTEGRLFLVKLYAKGAPAIYSAGPHGLSQQLRASIGEALQWADCRSIVSLVQHPYWYEIASALPNSRLVYDCMDHHEGFGNNASDIAQLEERLLHQADLTITTSDWLDREVGKRTERRALIRNACDFNFFSHKPASIFKDPQGRKIIGYYGAIAEWFDQDLVDAIAARFKDCLVLLIGADSVGAKRNLDRQSNIKFIGEVPYRELPSYLHAFDVCILPFKVIPLTLATNPVKVYEYLSAGKPVVSVDLPEIAQCHGLVPTAKNTEEFLSAVGVALGTGNTPELIAQRQAFAMNQTWADRAKALIAAAEMADGEPLVSVIVVTYNNLDLTKTCLRSLDEYSDYPLLEIIVVDNASADGSPDYLTEWVRSGPNRKLILNNDNRGFAAGNNQGLEVAEGDYLILLNNDTHVTPGWIRTLIRHHQQDKSIGLIGPVTNNIGNEAKIDIAYDNMADMLRLSASYTRRHLGKMFPLYTAAFFCVVIPRSVYEQVGPLDEAFGRGFFEDDDYCRRVEQIGLKIICAQDVFIHHHLSASFNKLRSKDRQALFEQNKAVYEAKWGPWTPHTYRKEDEPASSALAYAASKNTGQCNQ